MEVWEVFKKIDSYYAEETIERLASIVPGMDENSLRCFKLIFGWIEAAKNRTVHIASLENYMISTM